MVDVLRGIAALGLPVGIVSNSTGEVEQALRQLGVCYAPGDGAGRRRYDVVGALAVGVRPVHLTRTAIALPRTVTSTSTAWTKSSS